MKMIEINHLSKRFGHKQVLQDLTFSVPKGSVVGFVGENGAGKTTTMKAILGLLPIDEGEITVCGEPVQFGSTKTNRWIGYLPDVPQFYSFMTAVEYLTFCGKIQPNQESFQPQRVMEVLALVGLEASKQKIAGFSRGMKQRLGLAQALINRPAILICDEPTSALDPLGRKAFLDVLEKIKEETTVLFSSHILADVEQLSDYIAILHKGQIRAFEAMDSLKNRYRKTAFEIVFTNEGEHVKFANVLASHGIAAERKNNQLLIDETADTNVGKQLLRLLNEQQIVPESFQRIEPTLEAIYLEVIK
ncbi:ABC transporter ATP-binding protein [Enterococcus casseliflavus]|uniref:ABC transporter ATP-binding protein n=1 Tax=Enterococcus casseliflavus TaxID=37734 RepID=UPI0014328751|nr:ABC transporter ATP-binding protein [Enterococcus casseliflavus]NKD32466.1 ABC transporter ATP-binding protein [Enterococcus casseliflavus]